jgi:hypothetical protein
MQSLRKQLDQCLKHAKEKAAVIVSDGCPTTSMPEYVYFRLDDDCGADDNLSSAEEPRKVSTDEVCSPQNELH